MRVRKLIIAGLLAFAVTGCSSGTTEKAPETKATQETDTPEVTGVTDSEPVEAVDSTGTASAVFESSAGGALLFTVNNPTDEVVEIYYEAWVSDAEDNQIYNMSPDLWEDSSTSAKLTVRPHVENMLYQDNSVGWTDYWTDEEGNHVDVKFADLKVTRVEIGGPSAVDRTDITDQLTITAEEKTDSYNPFYFDVEWPEDISAIDIYSTFVGYNNGEIVTMDEYYYTFRHESDHANRLVFIDKGVSEMIDDYDVIINYALVKGE